MEDLVRIPLRQALVSGDLRYVCDTPVPIKPYLTSTENKADAVGPKEFGKKSVQAGSTGARL